MGYSAWDLKRVGHKLATKQPHTHTHTYMRRKWQPTLVFLPGKFHGWRLLAGYNAWGHNESDMTGREYICVKLLITE